MDSEKIKSMVNENTINTYDRFDLVLAEGKGSRVRDPEGREYIDFTSGIGVNALGFCDEGWTEAVRTQAGMLQHVSNNYYAEPVARAAEKLTALTGMPRVFFSNSGAEANEGAIKAARKYSFVKYGRDRFHIVTLGGSFHGRTMATVTATGQDYFHKYFTPFLQGFEYAETNDVASLHETVNEKTCAIMIEFIQAEGGVVDLDAGFVDEIAGLCKKNDILLIADEVQTGVGRTGKFMAYDHFDVKPDIVTIAKGLGGGLPIGCVAFGEKTKNVFSPGDHGTTFGGNPVVCAGAGYILSKFMDGGAFLDEIAAKGDYFREKLSLIPGVKDVSGLGLLMGLDIGEKSSRRVCEEAIKRGLMALTAKHKVRLLPPLNIAYSDIDEGLAILAGAIDAV